LRQAHLHVDNSARGFPHSNICESNVSAAMARHPLLAEKLRVTIGWGGEGIDEALVTADFLIASRPPRERLAERAPRLRWVQTTGAGVDHLLPLDWLPPRITLTNNSGPHAPKCEEFCLMALLALAVRLPGLAAHQRQRRCEPIITPPIRGRRCLVIGYGDLGRAAARAGKTLGLDVTAVNRGGVGEGAADRVFPSSRLDELLPDAEFVIVTTPLTPATRHIVDAARLALLPKGAGLVNVGRAALVDYEALTARLRDGHLSGAILDVHDPEPLPPESPLWDTPNLIVTPHVSCDDPRYADMLLDAWAANFARLESGEPLRNVVDREQGY
jgi:phosphoglycerate dehydrogenase-like enzyme